MPTPRPAPVRLDLDPPIAVLRLCDPERRNALGSAMFDHLETAIASIERGVAAGTLRAVGLAAEGSAFCAGFDLREGVEVPGAVEGFVRRLAELVRRIRHLDATVVAAVQGPALAGGAALVSACDLLLVTPEARVGYPAIRVGVSPAVSGPTFVAAVGWGEARVRMLGGEPLTGSDLVRIGWASELLPDADTLDGALRRWLDRLASGGPIAMRSSKRSLDDLDGSGDLEHLAAACRVSERTAAGAECRARMAAALRATGKG